MKNQDNLQYVFGCIITHSGWVKKALDNINNVVCNFNLTLEDKLLLQESIIRNGKKLWASALVMEEKRWRELLPIIKYTLKIADPDTIKSIWLNYLDSYDLREAIPKSPGEEAVSFLTYLLKQKLNNFIFNQVVEYELMKNQSLLFEFSSKNECKQIEINKIHDNLSKFKIVINESVLIKTFDCMISTVIQKIQAGSLLESIKKENNHVIFFKQRHSSVVKSISFDHLSFSLLLGLSKFSNLAIWVASVTEKMCIKKEACIDFVNKLYNMDIIEIQIN